MSNADDQKLNNLSEILDSPDEPQPNIVTDLEQSDRRNVRNMLSGVYRAYKPSDADEETARRLARLLVQEIHLYNQRKIDEGRRASNIYELVADTIEQSRTYFKERLGAIAEEMLPIFEHELIEILCEGDASKLGPSYNPQQ